MKIFNGVVRHLSGLFVVMLLLYACGTVTTLEVPDQKIVVKAVGPLFEGVNTATASFKFKDLLPGNTDLSTIHSVKIEQFKLVPLGEGNPENKGFTALLASPNSSMQQFGFSTTSKTDTLTFSLAENQDFLNDVLKDSTQTIVLDFNLAEDLYDNMEFEAQIQWNIQLKK